MRSNISDRIVLNVGGEKIYTSKMTLTASSLYFSRQFSEDWNNDGDTDKELYLDQNADDFKILLNFMRLGKIEAEKLTPFVLMLANYLGMEKLLAAVPVKAKRMAFCGDKTLLKSAINAGIMNSNDAILKKEFASLVIMDPLRIFLENQAYLSPPRQAVTEIMGLTDDSLNRTTTFIDGLNLLSHHGYNKFEEKASSSEDETDPYVKAHLQFSRLVEDEGENELGNLIFDHSHSECGEGREYALHMEFEIDQWNNDVIEASFGEEKLLKITEDSIDEGRTVRTRTSRVEGLNGAGAMEWLIREGYERHESKLEDRYKSLALIPRPLFVHLYSRPAQAQRGST